MESDDFFKILIIPTLVIGYIVVEYFGILTSVKKNSRSWQEEKLNLLAPILINKYPKIKTIFDKCLIDETSTENEKRNKTDTIFGNTYPSFYLKNTNIIIENKIIELKQDIKEEEIIQNIINEELVEDELELRELILESSKLKIAHIKYGMIFEKKEYSKKEITKKLTDISKGSSLTGVLLFQKLTTSVKMFEKTLEPEIYTYSSLEYTIKMKEDKIRKIKHKYGLLNFKSKYINEY